MGVVQDVIGGVVHRLCILPPCKLYKEVIYHVPEPIVSSRPLVADLHMTAVPFKKSKYSDLTEARHVS